VLLCDSFPCVERHQGVRAEGECQRRGLTACGIPLTGTSEYRDGCARHKSGSAGRFERARRSGGDIEPTGAGIDLRFADVSRVRGGRIVSYHTYYDQLGLLSQLGV
jgi:hypothetical protein